jgi:hypothetical protein
MGDHVFILCPLHLHALEAGCEVVLGFANLAFSGLLLGEEAPSHLKNVFSLDTLEMN